MGEEIAADFHPSVGLVLNKEFKIADGSYQTAKFFATGALIHPRVVITAAHCLKDTISVGVTAERCIPLDDRLLVQSKRFLCHPNYESTNTRLDFALIILPVALGPKDYAYPQLKPFSLGLSEKYVRYGYGGRNGMNCRFRTEMTFSMENKAGFVLSNDDTGVYGDSGGPVLVEEEEGSPLLIGVHTGREKDPETRELRNRSFMTPLTSALMVWIQTTLKEMKAT